MLTLCQTLQEGHGVIKSLKKWKAPGPDGYPNFFQAAWPIIHAVYRDICHFFNSKHLLKKFNHTLLFPIQKTKKVQTVNDYQPISLCNLFCKIISKILPNRLKLGLNKCIAESCKLKH